MNRQWPARIASKLKLDPKLLDLVGKSSLAFALKAGGALLGFLFHLIIARLLGATGTGIYFLALTVMTLSATVGRLGTDISLIRYVSTHSSQKEWSSVKGAFSLSVRFTLLCTLILTVLVFFAAEPLSVTIFNKPELVEPLRYICLGIMPLALLHVYARALQGLRSIVAAVSAQNILPPLFAILLSIWLVPSLGVVGAAGAYCLSATFALVSAAIVWRSRMEPHKNLKKQFAARELFNTSMPLLGAALLQQLVIMLPVLFLGLWGQSVEIGQFSVAYRVASLIGLVLVAGNAVVAPRIAVLYGEGDLEGLGKLARLNASLMTVAASPAVFAFLLFPREIMGLFGTEFRVGGILLAIMAIGQLVNVFTGSVDFLLSMTGHGRAILTASGVTVVTCTLLSLVLIPHYGGVGAAVAASGSLALVNLLRVRYVSRVIGIRALPFFGQKY